MSVIRVATNSRTATVAGSIAHTLREANRAEVQAIGAGAVNQAVKAMIVARGYLAEEGVEIVFVPTFVQLSIDGQERTAIRFTVEPR